MREHFAQHFLSRVACELAFVSGTMDELTSNIEPIKEHMKSIDFNESKELIESSVSFETRPDATKPAKIEQKTTATGYSFKNSKMGITCNITIDKILLDTQTYKGFEDFHSRFKSIAEFVNNTLGNREVTKVSLQKVNSIVMGDVTLYEEACSVFNKAIFAVLRSGLPSPNVKVAQEVLVMEDGNSASMLRNTFKALEAPNSYEATLDFDVVNREASTLEQTLNTNLIQLNQTHFDLFKWAVTDEMISIMGQKDS